MKTRLKNSLGLCALVMAVWALLGGSTMYWGLRLTSGPAGVPGPALPAPPALTPVADTPAAGHALDRMLGASPSPTSPLAGTTGRFVLLGVVAGPSGQGAALISVDGKPARTFRPGAPVGDGLVLQSVLARQAALGPAPGGPAAITLDMAALKD
jgi:general secretion pathway protein C